MGELIKQFLKDEDGLGTVEIVILIAVLVGVALLFRKQLINFVTSILEKLFPNPEDMGNNADPSNPDIGAH